MNFESKTEQYRKDFLLLFALFFAFISSFILIADTIFSRDRELLRKENFELIEKYIVETKKEFFEKKITTAERDLDFLNSMINMYLNKETASEHKNNVITNTFLIFSEKFKSYSQIRLLDNTGMEIIRIDNRQNAFIVPETELQDKSGREYFIQSTRLKDNSYYISRPDLNYERNQLEIPLNPVLRVTKKISETAGKDYVIVLNMKLKTILDTIRKNFNRKDTIFVTDNYGNMLVSDNREEEWKHIYDKDNAVRFQDRFPEIWKNLKNSNSGTFYCVKGAFTISSLETLRLNSNFIKDIEIEDSDYNIKIIAHRRYEDIPFDFFGEKKYFRYFIILLFSFLISFLSSKLIINKRIQKKQLEYHATTDNLTGLYNRRSVLELIKSHYLTSKRYGRFFTICFADINDLKKVNDTFGHDLGDIMIISFADILKSSLRESDVISRIGGDEFIILFTDSDVEKAKKGWLRVLENIKTFNSNKLYPFKLSVSTGFSEFNPRIPKTVDMMINEADSTMYENKSHFKETGKVIF